MSIKKFILILEPYDEKQNKRVTDEIHCFSMTEVLQELYNDSDIFSSEFKSGLNDVDKYYLIIRQ
jgi:hypothetical protein